jgi:NAD(P)-dependent dehydrogenase (short-subunit alcohol dehydrogenase family)
MTSSVLILGATGGIGRALALDLRASGVTPLLAARGEEGLRALGAELAAPWRAVDARDPAQVDALLAWADETAAGAGSLCGVVHALGSILLKAGHRTTDAEWNEVIAQNLTTAFYVVRAAAPRLAARGGAIVLFSSAATRIGMANHEAISAAKAGVEGLARASAATWAAKGVRVNVIAPGLVDTPLSAHLTRPGPSLDASVKMHPLGRSGRPDDLVLATRAALFSPWMTAQVVAVDGGLSGLKVAR